MVEQWPTYHFGMAEGGLQPRSITRDMKWGTAVPLPGYEEKVIYSWERWWRSPDDVQLYQFLGKDNVVYHSVIFPGTQIGTGDTYEGGKFSKSRGVGVFGDSARKTGVPSDVWRFYLLSHRLEAGDSEFNWDAFISANNNLLLKNLGNFVNRVVKFTNGQHYNGVVPDWSEFHDESFNKWMQEVNNLLAQYNRELSAVKLRSGISTVLHVSQLGNGFLQSNKLDNSLAANEHLKCAAVIGLLSI
jgi:methionyl-tRNA synthetase